MKDAKRERRSSGVAVPDLIRKLGHRDPRIRAAAATALPGYGEAGFYGLLRAAARGNRRQRQEAVNCLGMWHDVRALQPLLAALENDRRERTTRTVLRGLCAVIATALVSYFAAPFWAATFAADIELQVCAARALGNLGDVRAILPLIRLAQEKHPTVRLAARDALLRLLPLAAALAPDRARLLGANAVQKIAILLSDHDEPLVRETMSVLYAIGDQQAIPAVQRLVGSHDRPYLYQEAERLLAVLNERAAREELRTTLLRGSRHPLAAAASQLLRPVSGAPGGQSLPDHLLRPSTGTESSPNSPRS